MCNMDNHAIDIPFSHLHVFQVYQELSDTLKIISKSKDKNMKRWLKLWLNQLMIH